MATSTSWAEKEKFVILNPVSLNEEGYLEEISRVLSKAGDCDIIAASAGFDEYIKDWGHKLSTDAFARSEK